MLRACRACRRSSGAAGLPTTQYLPWDIRQIVSHPDPAFAADQVMEALEGGVSSIELRVDAAGEHGVVARSSVDIERVLKNVKLDLAAVALEATGASTTQGVELAALLSAAVGSRAAATAMVAFNVDPIGALARTGALPGSVEEEVSQAASFARDVSGEFPKASAAASGSARRA